MVPKMCSMCIHRNVCCYLFIVEMSGESSPLSIGNCEDFYYDGEEDCPQDTQESSYNSCGLQFTDDDDEIELGIGTVYGCILSNVEVMVSRWGTYPKYVSMNSTTINRLLEEENQEMPVSSLKEVSTPHGNLHVVLDETLPNDQVMLF